MKRVAFVFTVYVNVVALPTLIVWSKSSAAPLYNWASRRVPSIDTDSVTLMVAIVTVGSVSMMIAVRDC